MKHLSALVSPFLSAPAAVALVVASAASGSSLPQGPGATTADLTATIRAVKPDTNELELLSGVGHALRVYTLKVDPACDIEVEGEKATLLELKPGQIVHVRYRKTEEGRVAVLIETPPAPPTGGRP